MSSSPPRLRRLLLASVVLAAAVAGAWTGVRVAGPATYATELGDVRVGAGVSAPGRRGIEVYVPLADWGLRARVTSAPVRLRLEPRRLDRAGLVRSVTGGGREELRALRGQLAGALEAASLRAALLALAGTLAGGLLAALAWHALGVRGRQLWLAPASSLAAGVVAVGALAAWAAATWDADRLERPTYYASGIELERLLSQADQLRSQGRRYASQVDLAIRSIAGLLDEGGVPGGGGERRMLLASDVHNNALTLPALQRFAAGRPVILAGDFSINGSRLEAGLLGGLERIGRPVVAVSGNHDSPGHMRRFAARGIAVLTHAGRLDPDGRPRGDAVQTVADLSVAGFEDPLQYTGGDYPRGVRAALSFGDFPDGRERYLRAVAMQWRWWQALPRRPQVLVLHQESLGRALANLIWAADPEGPPLTILTGHTHRQRLDRYGPVTVVNSGTAGAGGVFGAGKDPVGLALLAFGTDGGLDAVDLVRMDPTTAAAQARRVIVDRPDCDGRVVFCHDAPEPPAIATATPSP